MCDQCFQRFCPPNCPNFEPMQKMRRVIYCKKCGERLQEGEAYYRIHGFPYCQWCLDSADTEELVRICEIPKRIWLEQMGFSHETVTGDGCL